MKFTTKFTMRVLLWLMLLVGVFMAGYIRGRNRAGYHDHFSFTIDLYDLGIER